MDNKDFSTDGLRSFHNANKDTDYYIVSPTAEDIRGADWEYSKSYTKSLVEGITTTAEMTDILMRRGIIGPEFEKRSNELATELANKIAALNKSNNSQEKAELAYKVATAREELFQWNQRLSAPLGNTCEQMADDSRLEYLTSRLIVNAEGVKVWDTFNDYLTEKEQSLSQQSRFQVMLYLQGLDSNFLENTPEATAMRELEEEASLLIAKDLAKLIEEEPKEEPKESEKVLSKDKKSPKKPV
jgi:hypothetical protein